MHWNWYPFGQKRGALSLRFWVLTSRLSQSPVDLPIELSSTVVACGDGVIEAKVDSEIVALNIEKGVCYGLNRVGSHIWSLLAEPIRVCDLCAALVAAYVVDQEVCERQVLDLLVELRAEGLITTIDEK